MNFSQFSKIITKKQIWFIVALLGLKFVFDRLRKRVFKQITELSFAEDVFVPIHYEIFLKPNELSLKTFGQIKVLISTKTRLKRMNLNAGPNIRILKVVVVHSDYMTPARFIHSKMENILHLIFNSSLAPSKYNLIIEFTSDISSAFEKGFFKQLIGPEFLLATQFEDTYASHVFPCFDDPKLKATFSLSVELDVSLKEYHVISNMPVSTLKEGRYQSRIYSFEKTPVISTYLLAWAITKLDSVSRITSKGTRINLFYHDTIKDIRYLSL